jgi:putative membrane protein
VKVNSNYPARVAQTQILSDTASSHASLDDQASPKGEIGMKTMNHWLAPLTCAALLVGSTTLAQAADTAMHSQQDTAFVANASAGGMTEIEASKLADTHAKSDDVKSFATKMVTDHTKAGDELTSTAQKDGFTPATGPTPAQQAKLNKLGKLNGTAFDKAYKSMMLSDHAQTVALFKKEKSSGHNDDLKSFASDTLPTIEDHLAMAKKL